MIQSISEPSRPQPTMHNHLRLRVFRPYSRHICVPLLWCEFIHITLEHLSVHLLSFPQLGNHIRVIPVAPTAGYVYLSFHECKDIQLFVKYKIKHDFTADNDISWYLGHKSLIKQVPFCCKFLFRLIDDFPFPHINIELCRGS